MKIKKWNSSSSAWVQEYPEVNVDAIVATGTPSSTTYLRGDGTWATVTSGSTFNGGTITNDLVISKDNPVLVLKDTGESNDTDHVGYLSFRDSANAEKAWLGFGSSGNTDFTVSNGYGGDINLIGGNVGIGTTSPTAKLSIVDSSTKGLEFEEITGGIMRILAYDRTNTAEVPLELRGDSIDFETNGTRRFLITDSGAAVTGALTVGGTSVSLNGHTHTFASLTSKPTTLSGYGITDAYSSSNPSGYQTAAQVASTVSALVDSAPSTLDTLNELAAALGDDPNFATTVTNSIATKLPLAGGTLTGTLTTRAIAMQNYDITGINALSFNDPGPNEGISWNGGNFKIYESPNDLTTNSSGNLQFVSGGTRRMTVENNGNVYIGGGLTIEGSINSGAYELASEYEAAGTNVILKGDSSGRSGIFFQSEKDGTNINHTSDFGYIQFHAYGRDGTSGESNELIIGVSNDSDDHLIFNAPSATGIKARVGSSGTDYTVWHSGNDGSGSGLSADNVDGYHIVVGSTGTDTNTLYFTT